MDALVFSDQQIDDIQLQRMEQRDVHFIVRFANRTEGRFEGRLVGQLRSLQLLKLTNLAEGYVAAGVVFIAADVQQRRLMDEDPDAMLTALPNDLRRSRIDPFGILQSDEDIRVN